VETTAEHSFAVSVLVQALPDDDAGAGRVRRHVGPPLPSGARGVRGAGWVSPEGYPSLSKAFTTSYLDIWFNRALAVPATASATDSTNTMGKTRRSSPTNVAAVQRLGDRSASHVGRRWSHDRDRV
jgi:hypothetical protein